MAAIPFSAGNFSFSFDVHVVLTDTPILLSIEDMDRLGIYFDNLDNSVVYKCSDESSKVSMTGGHPFIFWNPHITCMLTTIEVRRLHGRFGHPSTDKLIKLLEGSEIENIAPETRKFWSTSKSSLALISVMLRNHAVINLLCETTKTLTTPCMRIFSISKGNIFSTLSMRQKTFKARYKWITCFPKRYGEY